MASLRALVACIIIFLAFTQAQAEQTVTLFAAASTAPAIEEVAELYEMAGNGRVRTVFASSGILARQIDNGAPADLYLSANSAWMDWLAERDCIEGKPLFLFGNRLVLIQPAGTVPLALNETLPAMLAGQRLAMGDPDHVPAGIYARQALARLGLWESLSPMTARMKDVRAALLMVQRGEAAAGIVYESDTRGDNRLQVAAMFPDGSHEPIIYSAAILKEGNREAARRLLDFLRSPVGSEVFRRHGFRLE